MGSVGVVVHATCVRPSVRRSHTPLRGAAVGGSECRQVTVMACSFVRRSGSHGTSLIVPWVAMVELKTMITEFSPLWPFCSFRVVVVGPLVMWGAVITELSCWWPFHFCLRRRGSHELCLKAPWAAVVVLGAVISKLSSWWPFNFCLRRAFVAVVPMGPRLMTLWVASGWLGGNDHRIVTVMTFPFCLRRVFVAVVLMGPSLMVPLSGSGWVGGCSGSAPRGLSAPCNVPTKNSGARQIKGTFP